jgi:hypothetical protein
MSSYQEDIMGGLEPPYYHSSHEGCRDVIHTAFRRESQAHYIFSTIMSLSYIHMKQGWFSKTCHASSTDEHQAIQTFV